MKEFQEFVEFHEKQKGKETASYDSNEKKDHQN